MIDYFIAIGCALLTDYVQIFILYFYMIWGIYFHGKKCKVYVLFDVDKKFNFSGENVSSTLTSIAGLVHVNDLDLTTQILVSPCHTCSVYAINKFGLLRSIYRTGLTWKDQNLGRKVEVKYMNEPCNSC